MKGTINTSYKTWHWLVVALLAVTWGSSFILMKKSLVGLLPQQVAALRISITAIALLPFTFLHLKKLSKEKIKYIVISGLLGSGIPAFLYATAQTHLNSSLSGVLNSLTPVWALFLGMIIFKIKSTTLQIIGILVGFLGAVSLVVFGHHDVSQTLATQVQYAFLIVLATFCYGLNLNILRKYLVDVNPLQIASVSFLFIGIPAAIFLFVATPLNYQLHHQPDIYKYIGYVTVLAVVGTAIASIVFYYLVQSTSTLFGALTTYFIPVVAVIWGAVDGEAISAIHFIGLGLILFGVWLVTKKQNSI